MSNNQGIFHLNLNGTVACKSKTAHMYVRIDEFRVTAKRCKRCLNVLAKMDASAAKKAAREAAQSHKCVLCGQIGVGPCACGFQQAS